MHHTLSLHSTLLSGIIKRTDLNLARRIHCFSHTTPEETIKFLNDAGHDSPGIEKAVKKVHKFCNICSSSGRPATEKKVSFMHVNKAFNQEIKADFVTAFIGAERYEVLNIIDMGTGYGGSSIAASRSFGHLKPMLEIM